MFDSQEQWFDSIRERSAWCQFRGHPTRPRIGKEKAATFQTSIDLCSQIPGVDSVHELHAWRLNQSKAIASAHIVTNDSSLLNFMAQAERIGECLHAYGIHSVTLQPEFANEADDVQVKVVQSEASGLHARRGADSTCRIACGTGCEPLMCCN